MKKNEGLAGKVLDIWIAVCERRNHRFYSYRIKKELHRLSPGKNKENLIRTYYLEKIRMVGRIFVFGGIVLVGCICKTVFIDMDNENYLERENAGGGTKSVVLDAEIGEVTIKDIVVELDDVKLSDEDVNRQLEEIAAALPEKILGENESLKNVQQPLNLISVWEEGPVSIYWSSSDYGIMREDGSFGSEEISEAGTEIILTATIIHNDVQRKERIPVVVFPRVKTKEEEVKDKLYELINQQEEESKTEKLFFLPTILDSTEIVWKQRTTNIVMIVLGFIIMAVPVVLWGKDRDLHIQYEKRNRRLQLEYSEFVSKLQLLISSGMSIRSTFLHLGKEYQKSRQAGGDTKYVYEELLVTIRKIESGMSETEAYEYFGKCCDLICYKRLTAILLQNAKKGTEGLKESLLTETKNAFEERKHTARKMGEEAGTKLLFPMMLMMGVVLMIIVIPAYFSFGGM